jgi:hypothetical protein
MLGYPARGDAGGAEAGRGSAGTRLVPAARPGGANPPPPAAAR